MPEPQVVALVPSLRVTVIGSQQEGWLPAKASEPSAGASRQVDLRVEVHFDGYGYLLCVASNDGFLFGDTWHPTLAEAKQVAEDDYGVTADDWQLV